MSRRVASLLKWAAPDLTEFRDERSRSMIVIFTSGDFFLMVSTVETAVDRVRAVIYMCAGLWAASAVAVSAPRPALPILSTLEG
jgi:hypothetical protein